MSRTTHLDQVNSSSTMAQAIFDDVVLYPSPYMVVTPKGYTNHYYAGSERIASRIGENAITTMESNPDVTVHMFPTEKFSKDLAHELGHAENNMNGTSVEYNREEARKPNGSIVEKIKGNENERNSINYENQVRQQEGHQARSYDYYKAYNVE